MKWGLEYGIEDLDYEVEMKFHFYFILYLGHHETNAMYFLLSWVPWAELCPSPLSSTVLCSHLDLPFIILHGHYLLMGLFCQLNQSPLGKNLYGVLFVFLACIGLELGKSSINICWMSQTRTRWAQASLECSYIIQLEESSAFLLLTVGTPSTVWGPLVAPCLLSHTFFQIRGLPRTQPTWLEPWPSV